MTSDVLIRTISTAHPDKLAAAMQLAKLGPLKFTPLTCVYVMVNKATGRVYIGKTLNMKRRSDSHIGSMRTGRHTEKVLCDYAAHGEDSFGFATVHACDEAELDRLEREYITLAALKYDCYNVAMPAVNVSRRRLSKTVGPNEAGLVKFNAWLHPDDFAAVQQYAAKITKRRERQKEKA